MSSIPAPLLWTVILGLAVGSYALRFAFIGFMAKLPVTEPRSGALKKRHCTSPLMNSAAWLARTANAPASTA